MYAKLLHCSDKVTEKAQEQAGYVARAELILAREQKRQREGKAICEVPGCERPATGGEDRPSWCKEHQRDWDAGAEVEAARAIGHPELTGVMEEALSQADENLARARSRLDRAKAEL